MTEDEMAGWHHQRNAHEFEYAPGVVDGQGGLACCSQWVHKELNTTERLHFHFIHSKTIPQPTILIVLTDWLKLLSSVESSGG